MSWQPLDYQRFRNFVQRWLIGTFSFNSSQASHYANNFETQMQSNNYKICEDVPQPATAANPVPHYLATTPECPHGLLRLTRCQGDYGEDVLFLDPATINYILPHGSKLGGVTPGCRIFHGSENDCWAVVESHEQVLEQLARLRT